ncbi:hypothetical protein LCUW1_00031220, partial [Lactobacillus casei]|nr:hypothetical protein [Lacticaseibacillus casei]
MFFKYKKPRIMQSKLIARFVAFSLFCKKRHINKS